MIFKHFGVLCPAITVCRSSVTNLLTPAQSALQPEGKKSPPPFALSATQHLITCPGDDFQAF